jgi:phosphoribosylformylglycinamidine synthase PurS subunit
MKAKVFVTLKKEVLDPQGDAVCKALQTLGFDEVRSVRVGKFIELDLGAVQPSDAQHRVQSMCDRVLHNPVIEDVRFDLE